MINYNYKFRAQRSSGNTEKDRAAVWDGRKVFA